MKGALLDVWEWLVEQLSGMMPAGARQPDACFIECRRAGFLLSAGAGETDTAFDRDDIDGLAAEAASACRGRQIDLIIKDDQFVLRELAPYRIAAQHERLLRDADIEEATPFSTDEVATFPIRNGTESRYYMVLRSLIDPLQDALSAHRLRIRWLWFDCGETALGRVGLTASNGPWTVLIIAIAAAATLTFVHASYRLETAIGAVNSKIDAMQGDADVVRGLLRERAERVALLDVFRDQSSASITLTAVWEYLAEALPDTAYLTDLSLADDVVTLSGLSQSGYALLPALEETGSFESVELLGSTTAVPGSDLQRFNISLTVRP